MPFDCSPRHASLKVDLACIGRFIWACLGCGTKVQSSTWLSIQASWDWSTPVCWMAASNSCYSILNAPVTWTVTDHSCSGLWSVSHEKHGPANIAPCICVRLLIVILTARCLWIGHIFSAVLSQFIAQNGIHLISTGNLKISNLFFRPG